MVSQYQLYIGDIHNHCNLSYGRGTLAEALQNARLQLDFTSVTIHAKWPDMPQDDPRLEYLVGYHLEGFRRAQANWAGYLAEIESQNQDGQFVTFPSHEWHSTIYGDHCIYYKDSVNSPIIDAPDLPELRQAVQKLKTPAMIIPHHIGYKQGSRGIKWEAFSNEYSPVAEIFSFHGLSESTEGPYPYLHSMGPRHKFSTAQYGWSLGHVFGVIGSTDHHNAFPGSYGYGRMGVWAESLTRNGIWDAIQARRTYALTGDRIDLRFSLNEQTMGSICPADLERWIEVAVEGGDAIDMIEVLHNNQVIHRESAAFSPNGGDRYKIYIELGWGERFDHFDWDMDLTIEDGRIQAVEPRLRGYGPTDAPAGSDFAFSHWEKLGEHRLRLQTRTRPNLSLHTASTEGIALEIEGSPQTRLNATINDRQHTLSLDDLLTGATTVYMGGFVSPAASFHRAVPHSEYSQRFAFLHRSTSNQRDWYYVRVRQRNNQWAWSSPIWVD